MMSASDEDDVAGNDNVAGDMVGGDKITVGNVSGGSVVAVGAGAKAVYQQGLSVEEVAALVVELKEKSKARVWDGRIPYVGLTAFREKDAEFFFGRESLVDDLLARIQRAGFIAIAGPSGSGKSSVARAGLLHALREGRLEGSAAWLMGVMQPKGNPIEQLALAVSRLARSPEAGEYFRQAAGGKQTALQEQVESLLSDDPNQRCVLLVDQFEEVFTQTKDEAEREAFINLLTGTVQAEESRAIIIISLRSDFVSQCARFPELRAMMSREFQLVGAMEPHDLAKAITLPALEVGAEIDPALVSRIMTDMKGEPGALPLMSFALRDLFEAEKTEKGEPMDMTLAEYLNRGGIEKALERHANHVFNGFTVAQQALAQNIFSKLIEVGQGRVDTRRTAVFSELIPAGVNSEEVMDIVSILAQEGVRLITTSGGDSNGGEPQAVDTTVTIAHEKLIDAWPWLRRLVDENREIIALQNQINDDAQAWAKNEDEGFLYRGGRLIQVEERLEALAPSLDALSERFIQTSLAQRQREIEAKEAQQRHELEQAQALAEEQKQRAEAEQKRSTLFRRALMAGGVLALLLIIAVVIAGLQTVNANEKASVALTAETGAMHFGATAVAEADARSTAVVEAELSEARSLEQAKVAARALAAQAVTAVERSDPETAYLLAVQAVDNYEEDGAPLKEAELALFKGLTELWFHEGSLEGHTEEVRTAVFNHDGSRIVTASRDGTARLWDGNGTYIAPLQGHTDWVWSAAFSPDGSRIVTASKDKTARLWDEFGRHIATLEGHTEWVNSAAFNHDGSRIITASDDHTARLWDGEGNFITALEGHTDIVISAAFSHDGSRIITASADGTARLWDSEGNFILSLEGHDGFVRTAAFNHDGSRIITGGTDQTARLWDGEGNLISVLLGHTGQVNSAAFNYDGSRIITASNDGTARLWDENGRFVFEFKGHTGAVNSASFSPDGSRIVTAGVDKTARLWRIGEPYEAVLEGHNRAVNSAAFNPDGSRIVTASDDLTVRLWDGDGTLISSLAGHAGVVNSAAFNYDGSRFVTASDDGTARLWDSDGNFIVAFEGHEGPVNSAAFNNDGSRIVTASDDGTARLWDSDGNFIIALEGHDGPVNSAAFNHDGSRIVTAGDDETARLWDGDGRFLKTLEGHTERLWSAAFNHDGSRIITTSNDDTARLWDSEGNFITALEGHDRAVVSAVFNDDDSLIVTASPDGTVKLWSGDGVYVTTLDGQMGAVNSAEFSHDGSRIITTNADGKAVLWEIFTSVTEMRAEAMRRLMFFLTDDECLTYFDVATCGLDG